MLAEMPVGAIRGWEETPTGVPKARRKFGKRPADEGQIVDPCWRAETIKRWLGGH